MAQTEKSCAPVIFLYGVDVTLHLKLSDFTPEGHFHAALVVLQSRRNEPKTSHDHDFWELMYVVKGSGRHTVNGRVTPLQTGTLLLIRPTDCHTLEVKAGTALHFINIAFSAALWRGFCRVAGLEDMLKRWSAAPLPPVATLPASQQDACLETFRTALHAYLESPTRLALCDFWARVVRDLLEPPASTAEGDTHPWLPQVCAAMREEENLRHGLPRLLELSGVSPEHLARTFRAQRAQTPTAFVNALRLEHASRLLKTTSREILEIASDCGFDNLSYFYRLFQRRYGQTPRQHRHRAHADIVP
jgi:AraC-like DNA-binding protein/mannose-6-phosphate isomerase-like protein (cupin superfamily)